MNSSAVAVQAGTNHAAGPAASEAAPVEHPSQFFIDGDWVNPASEAMFQVINPTTEALFFEVAEAQEPDINRAVAAARNAFDRGPWPRMSHRERAGYLRAMYDRLQLRADHIARTWSNEIGIVYSLAQAFTRGGTGAYRLYADLGESFEFEERHEPMMGNVGLLAREPVGVVGAIIPWNGPIITLANKVAPTARRLRSGTVGHNSAYNDFVIGFGGFKQSGIGREGGLEGLMPFLESKTIILDAEPVHLAGPVKSTVS
jgi:acyl-CoA reductase-like NAD-dependent aldehyde dehydrogenase